MCGCDMASGHILSLLEANPWTPPWIYPDAQQFTCLGCSWDGVVCAVMLSQCYSRGCQPHLHLICAKLGHAKEKSSAKDSAGDTHRGGEENKQVREQENLSAGHCCVKPTSAASFPQCNSLSTDSLTNIPILCWSSPSLDAAMSLSFR